MAPRRMTMQATAMERKLLVLLLSKGQGELERLWGKDASVVSRRINNESGMTLREIAVVLEALGAQVVTGESVVVTKDYLDALEVLARRALDK